MVAGEADHDVTGTFVGIGFQPGSGFLGRTAEARLELPKRCSRDIVVVLKKFIEPLVCLIGIVVDGQCEIDRTAKSSRLRPASSKCCSVSRHCAPQTAVSVDRRGTSRRN